jgi:predicted SAM-dependent methyltransferase
MAPPDIIPDSSSDAALHQVQNTWSLYAKMSTSSRARLRRLWISLGFNHDAASKLRYEFDMVMLRSRCGLSPAYRRQIRELASRRHLLVHLGCGNALLPGWINLDCYPPPRVSGIDILTLDMRRGLPLAGGSVAAVFSEHFLEHLPFESVRDTILPEVRRILQPGGKVRIGVPNGEYFIDQYVAYRSRNCDSIFAAHLDGKTPMTMLNEIAHGFGHHFVYDFQTLSGMLRETGLVDIRQRAPFETDVEQFKGKDRVDEWRNRMTLYVEAEAPPFES